MDKKVKTELLELASKITNDKKRQELIDFISKEEFLLYVTTELSQAVDLDSNEKRKSKELFEFFW